jgi:hypothetical protein
VKTRFQSLPFKFNLQRYTKAEYEEARKEKEVERWGFAR